MKYTTREVNNRELRGSKQNLYPKTLLQQNLQISDNFRQIESHNLTARENNGTLHQLLEMVGTNFFSLIRLTSKCTNTMNTWMAHSQRGHRPIGLKGLGEHHLNLFSRKTTLSRSNQVRNFDMQP